MQSFTATASDERIDPRGIAFSALCWFVGTLLAILPLAHVTGLRNTLVGLIAGTAAFTRRIETVGENRTERVVSLVLLGDLVSLYLAVLRGEDPVSVVAIDRLKGALAGSGD